RRCERAKRPPARPTRLNPAAVPAVLVRAADVLALAERLLGDHLDIDTDRAERASSRSEGGTDLVLGRRPERRLEERLELLGAEPVVTAHEREHEPVAGDDRERFRGRGLR